MIVMDYNPVNGFILKYKWGKKELFILVYQSKTETKKSLFCIIIVITLLRQELHTDAEMRAQAR